MLALVAIEIAMRVAPWIPEYVVADANLGWRLRPGVSGWTDGENIVRVAINASGWFDRDHALAKAPGTLRIALVGDSFLSAFNLPFEKSFTPYFERALTKCLAPQGRRIEALNFGVPGYGTAQELQAYRFEVRRYRPDMVVLMMYLGNDIINNHPPTEPPSADPAPAPRSSLPIYQRVRLFATDHSLLAALAYRAYADRKNGPDAPSGEIRQDLIYRAPADADGIEAWRATETLLTTMAAEVAADGAAFRLVVLPTSEQVDPDAHARRATATRFGVESLSYAETRLQALASAHGIPTVVLRQELTEYGERTKTNLYGGYTSAVPAGRGHWNETGNRIAAAAVSEFLCSPVRAITRP
jgi:hypothetical protein